MAQVREVTGVEGGARAEVLRSWLRGAALLLAIALVCQVVASLTDDQQDVRDAWLSDTAFVLVASSVFGAIALAVALRGAAGDRQRQSRSVVGLTVLAVVLSVVGWFTAAPTLTALAALVLGRATGVTDRDTGTGAARAASVVSTVVVLGVLVFITATLVIENL